MAGQGPEGGRRRKGGGVGREGKAEEGKDGYDVTFAFGDATGEMR